MKAQTKAIVASMVVICLALAAVSGVTYSWFSDSEDANIEINTAYMEIADFEATLAENENKIGTISTIHDEKDIRIDNIAANYSNMVTYDYKIMTTIDVGLIYTFSTKIMNGSNEVGADNAFAKELKENIMIDNVPLTEDRKIIMEGWIDYVDPDNNGATMVVPCSDAFSITTPVTFGDNKEDGAAWMAEMAKYSAIITVKLQVIQHDAIIDSDSKTFTTNNDNSKEADLNVGGKKYNVVTEDPDATGVQITNLDEEVYNADFAFDIKFQGNTTTGKKTTITIPKVDAGFDADAEEMGDRKVVFINDNGEREIIDAKIDGDSLIITTYHNSTYAVVSNNDGSVIVVDTANELRTALQIGGNIRLEGNICPETNEKLDSFIVDHQGLTIIDLNGNILSATERTIIVHPGASLSVIGVGTICEVSPNYGAINIYGSSSTSPNENTVDIGSNVELNGWCGIFVTNESEAGGSVSGFNTTVNFSGKIVSVRDVSGSAGYGIYVNGSIKTDVGGIRINVMDDASVDSEGLAVGANGSATWDIGKATLTGCIAGIELRAGTMSIDGAYVECDGSFDKTTFVPNGSGSVGSGVAVSVSQHTTDLPISITINSGTFKGYSSFVDLDVQDQDDCDVTISIKGGEFISENEGNTFTKGTNNNSFTGNATIFSMCHTQGDLGFVSGGIFNHEIPAAYLETGLDLSKDGDMWVVSAPIIINTPAELVTFSQNVNNGNEYDGRTVKLGADLNLNGIKFTPIGNNGPQGKMFRGTFDGQGHTISNLSVRSDAFTGLFGCLGGSVKDLIVDGAYIESYHFAGVIAGHASTNGVTIERCTVKNSEVRVTVQSMGDGMYDNGDDAGAIIGYIQGKVTVNECIVSSSIISAYRDIGGIVGSAFAVGTDKPAITDNRIEFTQGDEGNVQLRMDLTTTYLETVPNTVKTFVGRGEGYTESGNSGDVIVSESIIVKSMNDFKKYLGAGGLVAKYLVLDVEGGIIDMTGVEWVPVGVNGYGGADIYTIEGNNHVIKGLSAPLFSGGFAGNSGIVIKDLTIMDSEIISTNKQGSGAFIECVDSMPVITLDNCHLKESTLKGSRTGGLIGWTSGYNNTNNGAVKTYVNIESCSVVGCIIENTFSDEGNTPHTESVGAIIGHAGANPYTFTTIENCTVSGNTLIGGNGKTGVILGTANVGEVTITECYMDDNTVNGTDSDTEYGRTSFGTTGKLTIDGILIN